MADDKHQSLSKLAGKTNRGRSREVVFDEIMKPNVTIHVVDLAATSATYAK